MLPYRNEEVPPRHAPSRSPTAPGTSPALLSTPELASSASMPGSPSWMPSESGDEETGSNTHSLITLTGSIPESHENEMLISLKNRQRKEKVDHFFFMM